MDVWHFIYQRLSRSETVILLCVLSSDGSSPGRQGFKMAVTSAGEICGTIGGGIMEQKSVEKARQMLSKKETHISVMYQYHDKQHTVGQSGMICSGNQVNAFIPVLVEHIKMVEDILLNLESDNRKGIQISTKGIEVTDALGTSLEFKNETEWMYKEPVFQKPVLHIFGGGHVSLALSEVMHFLDFYIKVYDDRQQLNTLDQNTFADEIIHMDYQNITDQIEPRPDDFIVIMSVGYRTDKVILKQLLDKKYFYLGLLGSAQKIEKLFKELKDEGLEEEKLIHVFAPVGINISSKTTKEIAVSVAAEIIREKNKLAPSARGPHPRPLSEGEGGVQTTHVSTKL